MTLADDILTLCHTAARYVGGVTITIDGGTSIEGVIVSEDTPIDGAGMVDGYNDARRTIELAILIADQAAAPAAGSLVTLSTRTGDIYQIVPGTVTGTESEWRFFAAQTDVVAGTEWLWADGSAMLWEDGTSVETENAS